ncbi:hypothetical protein TNCV_4993011 [Trichonephila clavipes]|nr:hypothetical protein TNCV_4993011 [Trichonephila clavipes]
MAGRDRPSSSTTEINTARIEEMIQNNRRVTLREISSEVELSYGSVQHIVSVIFRQYYEKTHRDGQGPDSYRDGLYKLVLRSDKCLNRLSNYV